jgi:hypothetical protein
MNNKSYCSIDIVVLAEMARLVIHTIYLVFSQASPTTYAGCEVLHSPLLDN